jgi:hypothetical protein
VEAKIYQIEDMWDSGALHICIQDRQYQENRLLQQDNWADIKFPQPTFEVEVNLDRWLGVEVDLDENEVPVLPPSAIEDAPEIYPELPFDLEVDLSLPAAESDFPRLLGGEP